MPRRRRGTTPIPTERALITVPVPVIQIAEIETEQPELPKQFGLFPIGKKQTLADAPDTDYPYYPVTKKGLMLHKPMRIGRAIVPIDSGPPNLFDNEAGGSFWYNAPPIPKELCSQIVDFFRKVYDSISSEAEVFLLLHKTEDTWKLWIPTQEVTGVSVNSVYEPMSNEEYGIPSEYLRVGSVHSHCMMGAFHSSTDVGDAEVFEGVHLTIGRVMDETPDFNTMIMVNKLQFSYKHELVGDWTDLSTPAPDFWFDYVGRPGDKDIKGRELFAKYPKPVPAYTYKAPANNGYRPQTPRTSSNDWGYYNPNFGSYRGGEYGSYQHWDSWGDDESTAEYFFKRYGIGAPPETSKTTQIQEPKSDDIRTYDGFENIYAHKLTDVVKNLRDETLQHLLDESIFLDREWDQLESSSTALVDLRVLFMQKFAKIASVLSDLDMKVEYKILPAKVTIKEV